MKTFLRSAAIAALCVTAAYAGDTGSKMRSGGGGGTQMPAKGGTPVAPTTQGNSAPSGQTGSADKSAPGTPVAPSSGAPKTGTTDPAKPAK